MENLSLVGSSQSQENRVQSMKSSYGMGNVGNLMNNMVHHHGAGSNSQQLNSSKFKRYSL